MKTTRSYTMTNRANSVEETRQRILAAVLELRTEKLGVDIVLADVADRAGVTVQTIIRRFGGRDALFDAAVEYGKVAVFEEREAPVGDIDGSVEVILDHYEHRGDWVIAMLSQEAGDLRVREITEPGKAMHREWVQTVFEPFLIGVDRLRREAVVDLLVVATDVYTWKLLRRDRGLDRMTTSTRMRQLVAAVLEHTERST